ncbi:unnamed protein product [Bemisia tabaci]|uniref:Uncharacterized protein n=1 Tax=Bemisia tabaci TaxID=7038 RepID=A0A9P0G0F6_BEMTA|nr:unnamed protein product [Bemisia tabaci]
MTFLGSLIVVNLFIIIPTLCEPTTRAQCRKECHQKHGYILCAGSWYPITDGELQGTKCHCTISGPLISTIAMLKYDETEFKTLFEKNPENGKEWLKEKGFQIGAENPFEYHSPDSNGKHSSSETEKHSTSETRKHSTRTTGKHSSSETGKHSTTITKKKPPSSSTAAETEDERQARRQKACTNECKKKFGSVKLDNLMKPIADGIVMVYDNGKWSCKCKVISALIHAVRDKFFHSEQFEELLKAGGPQCSQKVCQWLHRHGFEVTNHGASASSTNGRKQLGRTTHVKDEKYLAEVVYRKAKNPTEQCQFQYGFILMKVEESKDPAGHSTWKVKHKEDSIAHNIGKIEPSKDIIVDGTGKYYRFQITLPDDQGNCRLNDQLIKYLKESKLSYREFEKLHNSNHEGNEGRVWLTLHGFRIKFREDES